MTRFRAFTIHLIASVSIFLIFLGIMFFVWYPAPYFEIDGGWKGKRKGKAGTDHDFGNRGHRVSLAFPIPA